MNSKHQVQAINELGERLHKFHGGLRLRHNKAVSCELPVSRPPLPGELVIPLLQHRGELAEARVRPGEPVLKGQLIGEAPGRGAHVHASTSGVVTAIEDRPMAHSTGQSGPCVVLRPDGEDRWVDREPLENWSQAPREMLRAQIRRAGIVGLGGAVFPTDLKAQAQSPAQIHTLILNGAECEPYISCDEMLMRESPAAIVQGALILARAVGAGHIVIAIEDQMGAVSKALNEASQAMDAAHIVVRKVPKLYPEGGERQLVQTLTGREVPEGGYPQDLGLLVQNVATAAAVHAAIVEGTPLLERIVTVTGNGVETPRNLLTLIGTPVSHLIDMAGGYRDDVARLVVGGPMMGYALRSDDEPVVKATNCLLALNKDDVRTPQAEMPCIRCGECARVCPAQLMPQSLHASIRGQQWDEVEAMGLHACIDCGCCDLVCPSHIPLVSWFRYAKGETRLQSSERAAAEHARQRFEARASRLERAEQEKAERMARRKRKLQGDAGRKEQIAAALARAKAAQKAPDDTPDNTPGKADSGDAP